jgi:uncharacterized membrane protein
VTFWIVIIELMVFLGLCFALMFAFTVEDRVKAPPQPTAEQRRLDLAKEAYATEVITQEQHEALVEGILRNESSVSPFAEPEMEEIPKC